jgi:hypothetical protein
MSRLHRLQQRAILRGKTVPPVVTEVLRAGAPVTAWLGKSGLR